MSAENPQTERSSDRLLKRWGAWVVFLAGVTAVGAATTALASRWYVPTTTYQVDQVAQAKVNAQVSETQAIVSVKLGALQEQMREARQERKEDAAETNRKLNELLNRRH